MQTVCETHNYLKVNLITSSENGIIISSYYYQCGNCGKRLSTHENKKNNTMKDKVVQEVVKDLERRSEIGIKKYGTTLHDNNVDDYLKHLYEELLDAANYNKKLQMQNQDKQSSITTFIIRNVDFDTYSKESVHNLLKELGYKLI